jgi:hypothetical protein
VRRLRAAVETGNNGAVRDLLKAAVDAMVAV